MKKTNKEKFNDWMRDRIKNVFYSDNEQMTDAYVRIIEN